MCGLNILKLTKKRIRCMCLYRPHTPQQVFARSEEWATKQSYQMKNIDELLRLLRRASSQKPELYKNTSVLRENKAPPLPGHCDRVFASTNTAEAILPKRVLYSPFGRCSHCTDQPTSKPSCRTQGDISWAHARCHITKHHADPFTAFSMTITIKPCILLK